MNIHFLAFFTASVTLAIVSDAPAESPKSTLEFRIAVTEPADGYLKQKESADGDAIYLANEIVVSGADIEKVSFYDDANGNPAIGFVLTDDVSTRFWDATSKNTGTKLAILLDGKVVSAPNILQGGNRGHTGATGDTPHSCRC